MAKIGVCFWTFFIVFFVSILANIKVLRKPDIKTHITILYIDYSTVPGDTRGKWLRRLNKVSLINLSRRCIYFHLIERREYQLMFKKNRIIIELFYVINSQIGFDSYHLYKIRGPIRKISVIEIGGSVVNRLINLFDSRKQGNYLIPRLQYWTCSWWQRVCRNVNSRKVVLL